MPKNYLPLIDRAVAVKCLNGKQRTAVAVEIIFWLSRAAAIAFSLLYLSHINCKGFFVYSLNLAVMPIFWLLILSPLAAGRYFFYDTLSADAEAARLCLLFRYYRFGYPKAVQWRARLWGTRFFWYAVFSLPSSFLLACAAFLQRSYTGIGGAMSVTIFTAAGIVAAVAAILAVCIRMLRYLPVPYLLPYSRYAGEAFSRSVRCTRGQGNSLVAFYAAYGGWQYVLPLFVPYSAFSPVFQTARAITARKLKCLLPEQKKQYALQHAKKHGKIADM